MCLKQGYLNNYWGRLLRICVPNAYQLLGFIVLISTDSNKKQFNKHDDKDITVL